MGIYVDVRSKKYGYSIANGKYGVGFATLMFSRYVKTADKFIFEATGKEAISNIDKYLDYIQANMNAENKDALTSIENKLHAIRCKLRDNDAYYLDYSEIMGMVNNPNYNPMRPVEEMVEHIDNAIWGFKPHGSRGNVATQMMRAYLSSLAEQLRVSSLVMETSHQYIFNIYIYENEDDKKYFENTTININDGSDYFASAYYHRKMFMILKKAGLQFDMLEAGNKNAHVLIDKDYLHRWVDGKPFVTCSYQLNTTNRIYYLLQNTSDDKEKFYCYLKSQYPDRTKLESLVIDEVELVDAAEDEVSSAIGRKLNFVPCTYADVKLYEF